MRQHLSVFMLMARSTIYKILCLLLIMTAVEGGLFFYAFSRGLPEDRYGLELLLQQSRLYWVFGSAFLVMTYLLTRTGWKGSSKQGYTLMRLSVSEHWIFFWQSIYNGLCYVILWAVQVLVVMALCHMYTANAPAEYITGQTIFLAFYRSEFLHSLLPFDDILLWVTNIFVVAALAICSARYPVGKRRGDRFSDEIIGMSCAAIAWFIRDIGDAVPCVFAIGFALIGISVSTLRVFRRGDEDED